MASALLALIIVPPLAGQKTIILGSGNGAVGSTDPLVSVLVGPVNGPFTQAFTPADFAAARSGPPAHIIVPHPLYTPSLPSAPGTRWIATHPSGINSGSGLFAIDFTVTSTTITSVILSFHCAADDGLGDARQEGVFVNGLPVPDTKLPVGVVTSFTQEHSFRFRDVTSMVATGTNTLYVYLHDAGSFAGVDFGATIAVNGVPSASCTFRNGTGINPTGYTCATLPVVGTSWMGNVAVAPNTLATIVAIGVAGPEPGFPIFGGELLVRVPPAPVLLIGIGTHTVAIPSRPSTRGVTLATQGWRIDRVGGGALTLVLLNAQDLLLGI